MLFSFQFFYSYFILCRSVKGRVNSSIRVWIESATRASEVFRPTVPLYASYLSTYLISRYRKGNFVLSELPHCITVKCKHRRKGKDGNKKKNYKARKGKKGKRKKKKITRRFSSFRPRTQTKRAKHIDIAQRERERERVSERGSDKDFVTEKQLLILDVCRSVFGEVFLFARCSADSWVFSTIYQFSSLIFQVNFCRPEFLHFLFFWVWRFDSLSFFNSRFYTYSYME